MSSAPQSLVSLSHTSSSSRPRLRFLLILLFSALLGFATFTHGAAETTTGSTIQPIITFPQTTTQQECIPAPQYLIDVATCKQMCSGSYQNDERTICWAGCDWYNDGGDEYCKCACSQGVPRSDLQNPCVTGCGFADDTSKVLLCPANEFAQVENDGSQSCTPVTACSTATEYQVVAPTASSDRQCAVLSTCSPSQYEVTAATATSDRECQDVSVCDRRTEFEQQPPTTTSDRECATITICEAATQYETKAPTSTTDRECTTLTPCVRGEEYQSVGPTATSDRECTPITHCHVLGKYQTIPATFSTDAVCANLSRCDATTQYELGAPTATSDRVCDDLASCNIDQYETAAPTATSDRTCANVTVCDAATEYETAAPTATSDRTCANVNTCSIEQYETAAPTATSDRTCANVTACDAATQYETAAPTATSDRTCANVTACDAAAEYETAAPTATSDRTCANVTVCDAATQYETAAPTATSDRTCANVTACDAAAEYETVAPTATSDRACANVTACDTATEYETVAPTATSDRTCANVTACDAATEYETVAPTATSDRTCANVTACDAATEYETAAPTATSDRTCANVTACDTATQYEIAAPTATSDRTCSNVNTCSIEQYETAAPTATSDRECANLTVCDPATQFQATAPTSVSDRQCANITACGAATQYETAAATPTSDRTCARLLLCGPSQYEVRAPTPTTDRVCQTANFTSVVHATVTTQTVASGLAPAAARVPFSQPALLPVSVAGTGRAEVALPNTDVAASATYSLAAVAALNITDAITATADVYHDSSSVVIHARVADALGDTTNILPGTLTAEVVADAQLTTALTTVGSTAPHTLTCTCAVRSQTHGLCQATCSVPQDWFTALAVGTTASASIAVQASSTGSARASPRRTIAAVTVHGSSAAVTPPTNAIFLRLPEAPVAPGDAATVQVGARLSAFPLGGFVVKLECADAAGKATFGAVAIDDTTWSSFAAGEGTSAVSIGAVLAEGAAQVSGQDDAAVLFTVALNLDDDAATTVQTLLNINLTVSEVLDNANNIRTTATRTYAVDFTGLASSVLSSAGPVTGAVRIRPVRAVGAVSFVSTTPRILNTAPLTGVSDAAAFSIDTRLVLSDGQLVSTATSALAATTTVQQCAVASGPPTLVSLEQDCSGGVVSTLDTSGGTAVLEISTTTTLGRAAAAVLTRRVLVEVWSPRLPLMVATAPSVLRPIAGWREPAANSANSSTCDAPRWQTPHVQVTATFASGDQEVSAVDVTGLVAAGITANDTTVLAAANEDEVGVAALRPLRALRSGAVRVMVVRAGDGIGSGTVLGEAAQATVVVDPATTPDAYIGWQGIDAVAVSNVDLRPVSGSDPAGAGWLDAVVFEVAVATHALRAEGASTALLASLVLEDGWREPLVPARDVLFTSMAADQITIDAGNRATVAVGATSGSRELVAAQLTSTAVDAATGNNAACVPRVRANVTLDLDLPAPTGVRVSGVVSRITPAGDAAALAGIATGFSIGVAVAFEDGTERDMTTDGRVTATVAPSAAGATVERGANGALRVEAIAAAPNSPSISLVTVAFDGGNGPASVVNTTFQVLTVKYTALRTTARPFPAYAGSQSVSVTELAPINGTAPLQYQRAQLATAMMLDDGSELALDAGDVVYAVRRADDDDSAAQLLQGAVVEPSTPGNITVLATAFGSFEESPRFGLSVVDDAVHVVALRSLSTTSGIALTSQQGQTAGFAVCAAELSDGTQLPQLYSNGRAQYPSLIQLSVSDADVLRINSTTGEVVLLANSPGVLQIVAQVTSAPSVVTTTDVSCNLQPALGDVDVGQMSGVPVPGPLSIGDELQVQVRVNTGSTDIGSFTMELQYDASIVSFVGADATFGGSLEATDDGQGSLRLGGVVSSSGVGGSAAAIAHVTFQAVSAGAFVVEGAVTDLLDRQLPSQPIVAGLPSAVVAGRVWISVTGADGGEQQRRRRSGVRLPVPPPQSLAQPRRRRNADSDPFASAADVDGDGRFTIGDAFFTLRYVVLETQEFAGADGAAVQAILAEDPRRRSALDADRDGTVRLRDSRLQSQVATGKAVFLGSIPGVDVAVNQDTSACGVSVSATVFEPGLGGAAASSTRVFVLVDGLAQDGGTTATLLSLPGTGTGIDVAQLSPALSDAVAVYGSEPGAQAVLLEAVPSNASAPVSAVYTALLPPAVDTQLIGVSVFAVVSRGVRTYATFFGNQATTGAPVVPSRRTETVRAFANADVDAAVLDTGLDSGYNPLTTAALNNTRAQQYCIRQCVATGDDVVSAYFYNTTAFTCVSTSTCDTLSEYESEPATSTSNRECEPLRACDAATEYETAAPTATSDRTCANVTACDAATEYETAAPTATSDRTCANVTACDAATEYETAAPTATSDRTCANVTACDAATEYETEAPTATSDRTCANVTACDAATEYETAAPTATSDRTCANVTACDAATEYETEAPTATSDRTCSNVNTCSIEQYETAAPTATSDRTCANVTSCAGDQYEIAAPTATSDRTCANVTACDAATEYETAAPTATSDRTCANVTACDTATQYEIAAPTATSDRTCSNVNTCSIEQYETAAPTATSDRECANLTVCDPVTQFQATAPTATSDRLCANLTSSSTQSPTAAAAIASVQIPEASNLGLAVSVLGALVCCFGLVRTVRTPVWPLFLSLALCHVYFGVESVALSDDISFSLVADRCLALGAFKLALSLSCLCWLGACVLQSSTDINPFTLRPLGLFAIVCAIPITTAVALVAAAPSSFGASTGWCDLHQPLARGLAGILASCTLGFSPLIYASIRRIRHRRQFFMGDIVDDLFGNESRIQRPLLAAAILLVVANRVSLNLPVHLSVDDDIPEHMPVVNVMCAVALTAVSLVFLCTRLGRSDNNGSNKGGLAGYASPNNSGDPSKFVHLNTMPADDVPRSFVSRISKRGAFSPSTPAHLPGSISRSMLTSFRYLPRYENDSSSDDVSGMSISDKVHEDVSGIHEDTSSSSILRGLTSLDISDGGESIDLFPVAIDRQEVENADVESIEDNVVVV
ncbi:hypothetical protein, variant [Salpingoeca rosetta]|uniref:TNFR-Cys domain-containing protein n=1 Tax=Salpingoeca rosetta (strain ATCC 50818 / BSB-021) TaxID=946362 RepID=F2UM59_SALR5|nr:hypothetical protein, variant [Salpingoeca rosetta]EGD78208.1 hypothetical protein, variant [Salpingoeca rosetta]|eukprot:XP_004989884.1 hypothetical protein, variant [Salpingoeca rosetta]